MLARRDSRRVFTVATIVTLLCLIYLTLSPSWSFAATRKPSVFEPVSRYEAPFATDLDAPAVRKSKRNMRIALINTPKYHFEVVIPLLDAFSHTSHTQLELFVNHTSAERMNALPFLQQAASGELIMRRWEELRSSELMYRPDIAVLTSCSRDLEDLGDMFTNPDSPSSPHEIVCVIHEAPEWEDPESPWRKILQPWVERSRVNFVVLSEHVHRFVAEHFYEPWNVTSSPIKLNDYFPSPALAERHPGSVRLLPAFPPVFDPTPLFPKKSAVELPPEPFALIPGKFEPWRRNYNTIFEHTRKHLSLIREYGASIQLLGSGPPPDIPEDLQDVIHIVPELDFDQYWAFASRATALFPAFAHNQYLIDRASSSIATSVIVGIPVVGTHELVFDKYTYLESGPSARTSWIQGDGEEEMEVFARIKET
ncbi:hypothetical protein SAICODRAFT_10358 [Saitoella complicata NRRL Y-17804]|uniref:Uncharacterized protein n=1 Tax=Saitoella complicata (strain BCRC 22490 / CBS 7301 / JCM 7358 / NBRC 10748 / NRRL Y-17804) TaxID=698492 RepID=A0A0E9ND20_SAICN|nr:uncharacterized protein SAICODRAFT_10358 [Saitoella complicata NRRL Y-17804]ODQ49824.1 hypothetical protein SAICODRAFT_10358 [Saitoella complicata NRRL Y-17804]GAO47752.1 hypothetical protein G7K_1951-t1 [Saitoella complicata NRRL Y-17804]